MRNKIFQPPYFHAFHATLHTLSGIFRKVKFLLPLLSSAACTGAPKDDGSTPPSLYTPPKSWEANPKGGYKVNMITGRLVIKYFNPSLPPNPPGRAQALLLSYDIVKAHGGELKVETKEREGSAFIILIPAN